MITPSRKFARLLFAIRPASWCWAVLIGIGTLAGDARAVADEAAPGDTLAAAVAAAKENFAPPTVENVSAAKEQVQSALAKLNGQLAAWGATGDAWRNYLRLDELKEQLDAGDEAKFGTLRDIALQFFVDFPGLERAEFRATGNAIRHYANLLQAIRTPNLAEDYAAVLDSVAEQIQAHAANPTTESAANLSVQLRSLARMGRPQALLEVIREQYSHPNVFVRASDDLVGYGTRRDINEQTPVSDFILGTSIRGSGHTVGSVDVQMLPNHSVALMDLLLAGSSNSRTVGSNRSALIYSSGITTFSGQKRIWVDEQGIHSARAKATANTNSQITGIGSSVGGVRGCITTRAASKRAPQSKGQAQRIAAQHTEVRIADRLNNEAAAQIASANRDMREKLKEPLIRSQTYPASIQFSSSSDDLFIEALESGLAQLGAPGAPPAFAGGHAIELVAHESTVNNSANTMFSGRTLRDDEIRREIIRRKGELPEDMRDDEDRDPWSITFTDDAPVRFTLGDGGFQVLLKFRRFTSGERVLRDVNVSASYVAEKSDDNRMHLVRQGDLVVKRDGEAADVRIPIGEVALRSVLRKKFSKLFKERIEGEGLELPGKYKSLGKLPLAEYTFDGGWARVAWDMPSAEKVAGTPTVSR
jgi:hypothetical protein